MSKLTEVLNILANTDCASFKRSEPTAEEALEWLRSKKLDVAFVVEGEWHIVEPLLMQVGLLASGATPLEAIRNAMKGESDG